MESFVEYVLEDVAKVVVSRDGSSFEIVSLVDDRIDRGELEADIIDSTEELLGNMFHVLVEEFVPAPTSESEEDVDSWNAWYDEFVIPFIDSIAIDYCGCAASDIG